MTRILSRSTLEQLRSVTPTSPPRRSSEPVDRTAPLDSFEPTRPPARLRDAGDEFVGETQAPGEQVVDLARSVLGQHAKDLKVANHTALGDAMQDWVGNTVNCANFVSGLLIATGQLSKREGHAAVTSLVANLKKSPNFTEVSLDDAQPGDVVAFETTKKNGQKGHHVVVFAGRDEHGQPRFLGSDNVNADGTQRINESTGLKAGRKLLAVMHYTGKGPGDVPTPTAPAPRDESSGSTLRRGSTGAEVTRLQQQLAAAGFPPGPLDGAFGPKTEAAVRAYQQARGLEVDGVAGPRTRSALSGEAPGEPPVTDPVDGTSTDDSNGTSATARELEALATQKHGPQFLQKVKELSARLGVKPEWVLAVMKSESNLSPTAVNPHGGATGLIQFMPATARGLGTTTAALRKLSATEQLAYVEKYWAPFKGKVKSGADLYLATFWPAGVGKPDGYALGGAKVARVNPVFDLDRNGQITAGEFREYYRRRYPELS